jgi:hypothetical protein
VGQSAHNCLKISRFHESLGAKPHKAWLNL